MRPKIALVTSGVGTAHGGIGVVAQLIVSALQKDTDLSVWQHPASLPRMLRVGLIGGRAFLGSLKQSPDLVVYDHVHLAGLHAAIPTLRHIPYVVFLMGIEVWEPLVGRRREALLGAQALLAISATTDANARSVNPWLPRTEVVWLGVPPQSRPTDPGTLPPVGLIVGRMASSERKGHDAVMDAWSEIRAAVPDARLMIVGTGDDEQRLRGRVKSERLCGIEFCGRLSDMDRDRMYRSSRLLFYPSKQEGFGLASAEAASFGVPVLGLAGTVVEELFPNGTGAILARDLAKHSIAETAIPVLADSQLASSLGRAAWNRVQNNFLEEHFVQRFRRTLSSLIPLYDMANQASQIKKPDSQDDAVDSLAV